LLCEAVAQKQNKNLFAATGEEHIHPQTIDASDLVTLLKAVRGAPS
jgi:hypothetical protein